MPTEQFVSQNHSTEPVLSQGLTLPPRNIAAGTDLSLLPSSHEPFTDRYFLNTAKILAAEGLNPWVRAQVVIRKGPGIVGGLEEAVAILNRYSKLAEHGGSIKALKDGDAYEAGESVLVIEGPIQDFVELETMYLGVISAGTTKNSNGKDSIDLDEVERRMKAVVAVANGKPVIYMGARHWHYNQDQDISRAAFAGGASEASTEVGALTVGKNAVGTIPHVLENILAWKYGKDRAVAEATLAFNRHIAAKVGRTALIDYNNHEIDDTLATARALEGKLDAVRVDTCGENVAQGALLSPQSTGARELTAKGVMLLSMEDPDARYWYGNGVTVTGVYALRTALNEAGFSNVKIVLSSGFGDPKKVAAFARAEKILGVTLFDKLGVGGVYDSITAKTDIVAVGETSDSMIPISKAGRKERVNKNLKAVNLTATTEELH